VRDYNRLQQFVNSNRWLREEPMFNKNLFSIMFPIFLLLLPLAAQEKRLWVLHPPDEMTEYDVKTLASIQNIKIPAQALTAPQDLSVNHLGQMLFVPPVSLPLDEDDVASAGKIWFWDGRRAMTIDRLLKRETGKTGSNSAIDESLPSPYLSQDGTHLYWFANQAHRLQRDEVDLSTKNDWRAWQTDLAGEHQQNLASQSLPDCPCPTGSCEDSCPYAQVWVPDEGASVFFLLSVIQSAAGKDTPNFKSTSLYEENSGGWNATPIEAPLRRILDAPNATTVLEAIPDTGCCGWANQSDDQTIVHFHGKPQTVFDERGEYKNPDHDVSFYTENGELSPDLDAVALTMVATSKPNQPIQLSEQGQSDPEESGRIRKALVDLPAVEIKKIDVNNAQPPTQVEFLPHATLVGWLTDKEVLIVEDHLLLSYNIETKTHRKSTIQVRDAVHVFLR
jgi:hypothetical protein